MSLIESLGLSRIFFSLLLWVPFFGAAAGLLGLSTLTRARRRLIAHGRPTRAFTAVAGVVLLLILPLACAFLGGAFALERGLGHTLESGGERVVSFSVTHGAERMRLSLGIADAKKKLPAGQLHAMIGAELDGNRPSVAHLAGPFAQLAAVPALLERAFWSACDAALAHLPQEVSWEQVVVGARVALQAGAHPILAQAAQPLYSAAHGHLIAAALLLLFAHGLALAFVWWTCRRRLTVPE